MSTARAELVKTFGSGDSTGSFNSTDHRKGSCGFIVARFDMGAFNASTNPEGMQGLGSSDTLSITIVGDTSNYPRRRTFGSVKIDSIRIYASATVTLGTANNLSLRIVRGSNSTLANVTIVAVTEASLTANALVQAVTDLDLVLEEGDSLVLIPDGAIDATAVGGTNLFVSIGFERLTHGGRLSQSTAVA